MKRLLLALALLWPGLALAQQYTNHALMVGAGPGTSGFRVVGPCATGQVPTWTSGATQDPTCSSPPGTGTVLSVGLALPVSVFSVTGSPVTGTGTLTGTFLSQSQNTVLAGPSTGGAGAPAFRVLAGADLPAPSTTSLGGVQAVAPVTNQWINSISGAGIPTLSQPSFANISGTILPGQLPPPTTTSFGGVLSNSAVTSNWVNSINALGQPVLSQPTFNDIAGSLGVGQIQSLTAFSLAANATNTNAAPTQVTLSAFIDAAFGNAQGDVLYRGASSWTVLAPGTAGQVLQTQGASANPSWATVSGVGTVTSVTCGSGLSGGTFTASGTCAFSSVADGTVLSNVSGGSAASSANTLTAVIDHDIGNTQGDIAYRGGAVWSALVPGTSGQFLQTQGAGANPKWSAAPFINFLSGLTLSNDGTSPNTVLDIATGAAFDSTNASVIQLGSGFTKSTGGSWVSGSGSNGMGNGLTIAASTWYHVCLANNAGNADAWFDTSAVCANRPTGITDTKFRRIGSFKTDGSSHILTFTQSGDYFWENQFTEFSGTTRSFSALTLIGVPPGLAIHPILLSTINQSNTSNTAEEVGPVALGTGVSYVINQLGGGQTLQTVEVFGPVTNTSAQINFGATANVGSILSAILVTIGYVDTRGK